MSLQFNIPAANQPAQLPSPMDRLKAILGTQAQYAGIQGDQANTAGQLLQNTQTQNTTTAQQKKLQDDEAYKQQVSQIFQKHNGDVEGALTEMLSLPQTQASQDHVTAITNTLDKVQQQKAASAAAKQKLQADADAAAEKRTVFQQQQDEIKARNDYWAAQLAAGVPDLPENRKKAMADYDAIGKPPDLMNSPLTDNVIDKRTGQVMVKGQAAPHNIDPNSPEGIAADIKKSQGAYHPPNSQQSGNPALQNVDPGTRAAAAAAAEKHQAAYSDAVQAANDMNTIIGLARAGNKMAYSYAPVEGVLTLNTGRGVKRINLQEIEAYGGAGSAVDRIKAYLGKQSSGASIPDGILNDMATLHDAISANAKKAFQQKLSGVNSIYGSQFDAEQLSGGGTSAPAPSPAPKGVPPAVWNVMTPEEKALWK